MKKHCWLFGLIVTVSTSSVFAKSIDEEIAEYAQFTDTRLLTNIKTHVKNRNKNCMIPDGRQESDPCRRYASVNGQMWHPDSIMAQQSPPFNRSIAALRIKKGGRRISDPSIQWESPAVAKLARETAEQVLLYYTGRCEDFINAGSPLGGVASPWAGPTTTNKKGDNLNSRQFHCDRAIALAGGEDEYAKTRVKLGILRTEYIERQRARSKGQ